MKHQILRYVVLLFFILIIGRSNLFAQWQTIFSDDFNRGDGPLFSPWQLMEDTLFIRSNQIQARANKYGLERYTSQTDSAQIVELLAHFNFADDTDGRFQFFLMGSYIYGVGYGYSAIVSKDRLELHTVVPEAPLFQKPISLQGNTLYFLDFKVDASLENVTASIYTNGGTKVERVTAPSPKRYFNAIACGIENNNSSQKIFDNVAFWKATRVYDYLDPTSATIDVGQSVDILGRIFIPGITTQQGNSSLIKATLLVSNADLPGFQGDPRFEQYNVAKFSAVYNLKAVDRYEYKATVKDLPIGNYKFCYKYEYNNETELAGAEGYPGWFYVGTLKVVSPTSVAYLEELPINYVLYQNYPNPFNPFTTISFELSGPSYISLIVYNILGKEIKRLVDNEDYSAGVYKISWDGTESNGSKTASGIYFYSLITNKQALTKSMILLK